MNKLNETGTGRLLKLILAEGEGYRIEFKENLSNIDRELVAFANSSGGKIFFGISDSGERKGLKITNKLKSQIQDTANNCQPPVKILFEEHGNILIVEVREGEDKPCKCSSGFYTRVGPNSQKLSRNEIVEFFKSEGKIRFDELVNLKFDYKKHFDSKKLDRFLRMAGITNLLNIPSTLVNLGVAEKQEGKLLFNNTGILFFSKNLSDIYFHTAVTCALYRGREKVEVLDRKDFNEDIVSNIDDAMNFLKKHIPVRYEMTGSPARREVPEIPFDALREAVINAVAHRDYFEKGSNVMVEMFEDRIEITDFGGLPKGLKPEDFGKKSVLRNPRIADLLNKIEYIEKMGTGIRKMRNLMKEAGLKPPKFEFTTFFTATFLMPELLKIKGAEKGQKSSQESSQKSSQKILGLMRANHSITIRELSQKLHITDRAVKKNISKLKLEMELRRIGPDKGGYWEILKK
ncbi:putative DNA binding domain-containing protein [bacterium]|nr:HTH domain-containing protein [Candidatus Omnitrophota bacterium]MBU4123101.1 putative DNA binding domain-containing protein [bacterium]